MSLAWYVTIASWYEAAKIRNFFTFFVVIFVVFSCSGDMVLSATNIVLFVTFE